MKVAYMINGWEESKDYFFDIGRFTEEEKETLEMGEIVSKNGNEFWITVKE